MQDDTARVERWGSCWNRCVRGCMHALMDGWMHGIDFARIAFWISCLGHDPPHTPTYPNTHKKPGRYYELEVEYFMSALAASLMEQLTQNFLWMRALATTPALEKEVGLCAIRESVRVRVTPPHLHTQPPQPTHT